MLFIKLSLNYFNTQMYWSYIWAKRLLAHIVYYVLSISLLIKLNVLLFYYRCRNMIKNMITNAVECFMKLTYSTQPAIVDNISA